jgi:hypothetical protein
MEQVRNILTELLYVLNEMGAIDWRIVTGDGTKIKAYASKNRNIGKGRTDKLVKTYKKMAENIVKRDLELEQRESNGEIEEDEYHEEKKRITRQKKVYESVLNQVEDFRKNEKNREVLEKENYNLTDPDSKMMIGSSRDHYIQGYNTILMVSNNDIIVDYETTTVAEKKQTGSLVKRVEAFKKKTGKGTEKSKYLFDSGFQDMSETLKLEDEGLDIYADVRERDFVKKSRKRRDFRLEQEADGYSLVCRRNKKSKATYNGKLELHTFWFNRKKDCGGCEFNEDCYRNIKEKTTLKTVNFSAFELKNRAKIDRYLKKIRGEAGRKIYNRRFGKEHVNANLKTQKNYLQTYYRGIKKVMMDNCWAILSHNITKYCKYQAVRT